MSLLQSFKASAREFRKPRSLAAISLLLALRTVVALFLSIQVTESLRVSLSFLISILTGCLFGPFAAMVSGGAGDLIQFAIKPTGPYFPGWTLNAMLAGILYGLFFYGRFPRRYRGGRSPLKERVSVRILLTALPAAAFILLFTVPFLAESEASNPAAVISGSAVALLRCYLKGLGVGNSAVLTILLLLVTAFALIINIWDRHAASLVVTVVGCFTSILAVYTEKKTMTAQYGFWLVLALLLVYAFLQMMILADGKSFDVSFLLRCTVALTLDTVLINVLLGTLWVSIMYGKGFGIYLTVRLIKNLVQLPMNIILTYYILVLARKLSRQMKTV